jgi:hypothetical protein
MAFLSIIEEKKSFIPFLMDREREKKFSESFSEKQKRDGQKFLFKAHSFTTLILHV